MRPGERPGTLRASRPNLGLGVAVVADVGGGGHGRDLPAQEPRAGRLAERRVPARGAARLGLLGARARPVHVAAQRGRVQLLPPAAGRSLHDRRQPQLGRARRRSRSSRSSVSTIAELARSRALEAERRRAEADLAAALARELLGGSETAQRAGGCRPPRRRGARARARPRSSWARSRATRAAARSRCAAPTAPRSRRCSSRAELPADAEQRLLDATSCRRSGRSSRSPCAGTRCRPRRSRPRRCGAATTSRPRCCARSRTTCARR